MKIACAIPARLESKRFPRKVLADFGGEPLVCHVWRQLSRIEWLDYLCVVTDSVEVREAVEQAGGRVLMSSPNCASGTERIWSVLEQIPGDIVINVQADQTRCRKTCFRPWSTPSAKRTQTWRRRCTGLRTQRRYSILIE